MSAVTGDVFEYDHKDDVNSVSLSADGKVQSRDDVAAYGSPPPPPPAPLTTQP